MDYLGLREKVDSCEARNCDGKRSPEEAGACNPNVAAESFDVGFNAALADFGTRTTRQQRATTFGAPGSSFFASRSLLGLALAVPPVAIPHT